MIHQKIFLTVEDNQFSSLILQEFNIISEYHITLKKNAKLELFLIFLHDFVDLQISIYIYAQDDNSSAQIKGIYALDGEQNLQINTFQKHFGKQTKSNLILKGILKDKSKVSYQGLIFIDKDAKGTDASQQNKNIVLSKQAKVVSVPSIEVLEFDVKCSHGSAIGQFDQMALWYLQSKGINEDLARELLMRSFFDEICIDFKEKNKLMEKVCKKMI